MSNVYIKYDIIYMYDTYEQKKTWIIFNARCVSKTIIWMKLTNQNLNSEDEEIWSWVRKFDRKHRLRILNIIEN